MMLYLYLNTNKNIVFISIKAVVVNRKATLFYTRRTLNTNKGSSRE